MKIPGDWLVDGPAGSAWTLILAHGAGVAMDAPFMETIAAGLGERGLRVVRFNFPYMARAIVEGRRRPPDREPVLREHFQTVIAEVATGTVSRQQVIIGGKSLGGRMASLIADEEGIAGLVCLGYPFHPPGKPERLRTAHLEQLRTPTLICQGERDPFGNREDVGAYQLSHSIKIHWLPDGEHSFKPRKASGRTEARNLDDAINAISGFVKTLNS